MQQAKPRERLVGLSLLSVLVLLGAVAVLSNIRTGRGQRMVGLMPEVVSIADRPRLVMNEVLVRASRLGRDMDAVTRLSGINK